MKDFALFWMKGPPEKRLSKWTMARGGARG